MAETQAPRDRIAEAREILDKLRPDSGIGPGTPMFGHLAQRAIGLTLLAISGTLDEILSRIEPATVPGLPEGYEITTQQTGNGIQNWRYVLTGPEFSFASRYRWGDPETALVAGIRHAREREQGQQQARFGPLLEAAREAQALNEPVHVNGERTDVYGIANPEVD